MQLKRFLLYLLFFFCSSFFYNIWIYFFCLNYSWLPLKEINITLQWFYCPYYFAIFCLVHFGELENYLWLLSLRCFLVLAVRFEAKSLGKSRKVKLLISAFEWGLKHEFFLYIVKKILRGHPFLTDFLFLRLELSNQNRSHFYDKIRYYLNIIKLAIWSLAILQPHKHSTNIKHPQSGEKSQSILYFPSIILLNLFDLMLFHW